MWRPATLLPALLCLSTEACVGFKLFAHSRREFISLAFAGALVGSPQAAFSADTIKLAGIEYTPAAMILQMAENTASMEGILRQSAKEAAELTERQRDERGATNMGPGVIGRADMMQSIDVMIKNSQLTTISGGSEAASTLMVVKVIANTGKGPLSADEYELMAKQYSVAREDLRRAFEAMAPDAQAKGKDIVRGLREKDAARMRQLSDEDEKLRRLRAKIAEDEAAAAQAAPPKKKTLAELEAAQAGFNKKQPVVSLYAQ